MFVDPAGQLETVVSSDLGLHVSEDGGESWYWICEDIIGFDVVAFGLTGEAGASAGDRVWLAGGTGITQDEEPMFISGLYRSVDGGCNWEAVGGGFGEQWTSGLSVNPTAPSRVVVTTDHTMMPNGIALSDDGGATWRWPVEGSETKLGTLLRAPSDPNVLYATATTAILRSRDDGESWEIVLEDLVEESFDELSVHAIDPEDPDLFYFSRLGAEGRWLYGSRDGGTTSEILLKPDTWEFSSATVVATDVMGGRMLIAGTSFGDGFRSVDGGDTWEIFFTDVESIDCLVPDFSESGSAWVCSNPFVQIITPGNEIKAIGKTTDGAETVDGYFAYTDTTDYRVCDPDSQVQTVCVALIEGADAGADADAGPDVGDDRDAGPDAEPDTPDPDSGPELDMGADTEPDEPEDGGGCGCRTVSGPQSSPAWLRIAARFTLRSRLW
jgi:hypothetical protein